ncbi:MAG: hypothetical protein EXR07_09550 [Acetobacteraceae bacterium]|nr:hypothetical protein [Acetobacteraceae bacterium]
METIATGLSLVLIAASGAAREPELRLGIEVMAKRLDDARLAIQPGVPGFDAWRHAGLVRPSFSCGGQQGVVDWFVTGSYHQNNVGVENRSNRVNAIHDRTSQFPGLARWAGPSSLA